MALKGYKGMDSMQGKERSTKEKRIKKLKICNGFFTAIIMFLLLFNVVSVFSIIMNIPFEYVVPGSSEVQEVVFSMSNRVFLIVGGVISIGLILYPLVSIKKIIIDLNKNEIFTDKNINRLTNSGMFFMIYILLSSINMMPTMRGTIDIMKTKSSISLIGNGPINELLVKGFGFTFNFELLYILSLALFIIVLVEIIKVGKLIKDESDLTI